MRLRAVIEPERASLGFAFAHQAAIGLREPPADLARFRARQEAGRHEPRQEYLAIRDVLHGAVGADARTRVEKIERRVVRQERSLADRGRLLSAIPFHVTSPLPVNIY